jgi:hypothetical protein
VSRSALTSRLPSLALALIAAVYVWMAYDYDLASRSQPWIAGVLALVLALVDVASRGDDAAARALRGPSGGVGPGNAVQRSAAPSVSLQEAIAFAWIGAFLPLVVVFGFYASILLYVFCYLRLYARKGALASVATAFVLAGSLYLAFEVFMGYEIFGGLLAGDSL